MRKICLRTFSGLASVCAAALLMGASSPVVTRVTSSVTGSVTSKPTTSLVSRISDSLASKTTGTASGIKSSVTGSTPKNSASKCATSRPMLSSADEEIAKLNNFDRQALLLVRTETQEHLQRLIGYDENDYQIIAPGVALSVPQDKADRVLAALRKKLTPHRYMAFIVEMNAGLKMAKIGVIKGTDQYEILRIMHTDGGDYDISHQDVLDRLKEWEKCCPLDIIGAGSDWVEIEFKRLPKDLKTFAEEVGDFSPDAVEQGPGSIAALITEIQRTNRLLLLWN